MKPRIRARLALLAAAAGLALAGSAAAVPVVASASVAQPAQAAMGGQYQTTHLVAAKRAAATGSICESVGGFKCLGSIPDAGTGSTIIAVNQPGRTWQFNPGLCNGCTGTIHSTSSGNCIKQRSSSDSTLTLQGCSQVGVSWKFETSPSGHRWKNVHYGTYIGCSDSAGQTCFSVPLGTPGFTTQFAGPA